jgi:thymidine kinase
MELLLILGPMKSGKSFEMISHFLPLSYSNIKFGLYQPDKNSRDENIWSRNGISIEAQKIKSLRQILKNSVEVVGIDEVHMFNEEDAEVIAQLLKYGVKVIATGLDMDYRGKMFPIIKRLFELSPKQVTYKHSICEHCKNTDAVYTQIYKSGKPVLEGLPSVVPEDGSYEYQALCRRCFKTI